MLDAQFPHMREPGALDSRAVGEIQRRARALQTSDCPPYASLFVVGKLYLIPEAEFFRELHLVCHKSTILRAA